MPQKQTPVFPTFLASELKRIVDDFNNGISDDDIRTKTIKLAPAFHILHTLGCSLIPGEEDSAGKKRILEYFRRYPQTVISGDELMVVSGIKEWARRTRELRVEEGWPIVTGNTIREMEAEGEHILESLGIPSLRPNEYVLLCDTQNTGNAERWKQMKEIRNKSCGAKKKILEFLKLNVLQAVSGEELKYVSGDSKEWARRVRELRTEEGYLIATKMSGNRKLPPGVYMLMDTERQKSSHERNIPKKVREAVLERDKHSCQNCGWSESSTEEWDPPRFFLELHHIEVHAKGGENTTENLVTLCNVCHDKTHKNSQN